MSKSGLLLPLSALVLLACPVASEDDDGFSFTGTTGTTDDGGSTDEESTSESGSDEVGDLCGDGMVQEGEECDMGAQNGADKPCTPECKINVCGDGYQLPAEQCDDGNADNTDDCVANCQPASCGDGFTQAGVEACDDGNDVNDDFCNNACELGSCGDGIVQDGEQCDDGNTDETDDCPACQLAYCGDGYTWAEHEECDDGNDLDNDDCLPTFCVAATCGDGFINEGVEECDDGNTEANDSCTDTCATAVCGDGIKQDGVEECDDGNDVDDDFCTNDCVSLLWWAEGPQTNVPEDMLGGWTQCWTGLYGTTYASLDSTILGQQCTGNKLLMGCRQVGSTVFTLLAMGEREDVIFDVGNLSTGKHEANGVAWYYSNAYSWGFALAGDTVSRNSCDTGNVNPQYRLCWHTSGNQITSGYRCGSTTLNGNNSWERVIYQAD